MGPDKTDFRYILAEDTYVVWLAEANRFLQLKEPAFFVFEAWAGGKEPHEIAGDCALQYGLPPDEALRFTREIIGETEKLCIIQHKDTKSQRLLCGSPRGLRGSLRLTSTVLPQRDAEEAQSTAEINPPHRPMDNETPVSSYTCMIHGKTIRFSFSDPELEELFRPMFRQFELNGGERNANFAVRFNGRIHNNDNHESLRRSEMSIENVTPPAPDTQIEFYYVNGNYTFRVNDQPPQTFTANDTEHFQGAVLLEILNILHDKNREDWMGIFHASAVSFGDKALLFTADSGGGKSTLAALLVADGCKLISDDFVPVSVAEKKLFPLPSAISVKKGSLPQIEKLFPVLQELKEEWDGESELFLPLPDDSIGRSPVGAAAIIFVKYDPSVTFSLNRESNLEKMNDFLKQSWIPGTAGAAKSFLEWYFSLPVYSLSYYDESQLKKFVNLVL